MTATLFQTWSAGFTRRWHSNKHLCDVVDTVDAHSARMARMALDLFPASPDVSIAALYHDLAESVIGDMPHPAKAMMPAIRSMESAVENDNGWGTLLTEIEQQMLKLVDRLDAYLMVLHHKPRLRKRADWRADHADLLAMADAFDVGDAVREMIREARE